MKFLFEGKAIGSLVGGVCWDAFGSRRSLMGWGIANLTFGLIYVALQLFWLRKLNIKDHNMSTDEKKHGFETEESRIPVIKSSTETSLVKSEF